MESRADRARLPDWSAIVAKIKIMEAQAREMERYTPPDRRVFFDR
ncbi:hypothetical protein QUA41_08470 [Microcoleus sp. Pol11C1]